MNNKMRLALAVALGFSIAGCASQNVGDDWNGNTRTGAILTPESPLQCVAYARAHSGIKLFGDAYTWWDQAAGKFERAAVPKEGWVMVLDGYSERARAHLAVVRSLVGSRQIKIDHANWLNDGAIYVDDPVLDVSAENDWSAVRVWNIRTGAWGTRTYNVRGFIGPGPEEGEPLPEPDRTTEAISVN